MGGITLIKLEGLDSCLGGLFVLMMMLQMPLLLRGHLQLWWPKIRQRCGMPSTVGVPGSPWRVLAAVLGLMCGALAWRKLASSLALHPAVDYFVRLVYLGIGEIIFLVLFDGWLLLQELRRR